MKNLSIIFVTVCLALSIFIPAKMFSEVQRQVLRNGSYQLEPKGSSLIGTFCYDKWLESPNSSSTFRYVRSSGKPCVAVGDGKYTLRQAIDSNFIELNGVDFTFVRVLEMTFEEPENNIENSEQLEGLRKIWDGCTPSEKHSTKNFLTMKRLIDIFNLPFIKEQMTDEQKAEIELFVLFYRNASDYQKLLMEISFEDKREFLAELFDLMAAEYFKGDYNRLVLYNRTYMPLTVSFDDDVILGVSPVTDYFPVNEFNSQLDLWKSSIISRKNALIKLGYLSELRMDDSLDFSTIMGIRQFQIDNDLALTGNFNPETDRKLYEHTHKKDK